MVVMLMNLTELCIQSANLRKSGNGFDIVDPIDFFKDSLNELSVVCIVESVEPDIF